MSQKVTLTVGGRSFETSRETLDKHPNSRFDECREFDRDPDLFVHVMRYMRGYQNGVIPDRESECLALLEDANFYRLPALADAIKIRSKAKDDEDAAVSYEAFHLLVAWESLVPASYADQDAGRLALFLRMGLDEKKAVSAAHQGLTLEHVSSCKPRHALLTAKKEMLCLHICAAFPLCAAILGTHPLMADLLGDLLANLLDDCGDVMNLYGRVLGRSGRTTPAVVILRQVVRFVREAQWTADAVDAAIVVLGVVAPLPTPPPTAVLPNDDE